MGLSLGDLLADVVRGDGTVEVAVRWAGEQRQRQRRRIVELVP